jgi:pimeloyl-ACP methyl ester carboxylesterase
MDDKPPILYAKSGDVHIAYTTFGNVEGEDVLVTLAATFTIETMLSGSSPIEEVARHARVTVFDKRGTGASDPVANFTFEERIDDLRAVMDAAGIESAHLFGSSEGGPMSILFAATYPERVRSLTLYGTFPSWTRKADYPYGLDMNFREYSRRVDRIMSGYAGNLDDLRWFMEMWTPSMAADPDFLSTTAELTAGIPPAVARTIFDAIYEVDVRHLLPALRVPTTIVTSMVTVSVRSRAADTWLNTLPGRSSSSSRAPITSTRAGSRRSPLRSWTTSNGPAIVATSTSTSTSTGGWPPSCLPTSSSPPPQRPRPGIGRGPKLWTTTTTSQLRLLPITAATS